MPAQRTGYRRVGDVRMRFDHDPESFTLPAGLIVQALVPARPAHRDALQDAIGRLIPITWHLREATVTRRLLELVERLDAKRFVNGVDLRGRQPGNVEHVEQAFRRRLTKLLEVARLAVLEEIANHGERGGPE